MALRFQQQVTFLYTSDLDRTAAFYEGILGLLLVLDQGPCRIYRAAGDAFLGFCRQTATLSAENAGVVLTLVVFDRPGVDGWAERLASRGVPIERGPLLNETFNIYHLFLRDPEGYLVEIQAFLDSAWPKASASEEVNG